MVNQRPCLFSQRRALCEAVARQAAAAVPGRPGPSLPAPKSPILQRPAPAAVFSQVNGSQWH